MDVGLLYIGVPLVFLLIGGGLYAYTGYRNRHNIAAAYNIYQNLRQTDPLYIQPPGVRYQHRQWPARMPMFEQSGILVLRRHQLDIHPYLPKLTKPLIFDVNGLSWFYRHRATDKDQEILLNRLELHFHNHNDTWHVLMLTLEDTDIERFMQSLKQVMPIYPRHHPYNIFKPTTGQIATQDIQGSWTLGAKYTLYLSSVDLIIARGRTVIDRIPFDEITDVAAMRRIDTRLALAGLMRFRANDRPYAFAMTNYEDFAAAFAEMAGVQLQWATERKTKKM